MAQLVKCLTLGFSSDHDLGVHEIKPHIGLCANSVDSLSLTLSALPLCVLSLSLSQNKHFLKSKNKRMDANSEKGRKEEWEAGREGGRK